MLNNALVHVLIHAFDHTYILQNIYKSTHETIRISMRDNHSLALVNLIIIVLSLSNILND